MFAAIVNGVVKSSVTFKSDGSIEGLSSFENRIGFHLLACSRAPEEAEAFNKAHTFTGLYTWCKRDAETAPAVHHNDMSKTVRLLANGTFALLLEGKEIDISAPKDGLPSLFAKVGLYVHPWQRNRYETVSPSLVRVEDDIATIAFAKLSNEAYISINEESWYATGHPVRTIVLLRAETHQALCLASKYDVFGFKDKLGFEREQGLMRDWQYGKQWRN